MAVYVQCHVTGCSFRSLATPSLLPRLCCGVGLLAQVIAIDVDDPLAKDLNDIADVEEMLPGYVSGIREWFRWYKTPDDKPLNGFGFDEKALDKVCPKTVDISCV